jgi:hypothetical protein
MLAKEAARSENMQFAFDRIPKSTLQYKAEEEAKKRMANRVVNVPQNGSH